MNLSNKRVLITAGPTWVPIDSVRVISNVATGQTGVLLAEELSKIGLRVTLVLGPGEYGQRLPAQAGLDKRIKTIRFKFFAELRSRLKKELKAKSYDLIIHSAAVSDFRPQAAIKGKLSSDKTYNLKLVPLPKIVNDIKRLCPLAKLVLFKLEAGVSDRELIRRSRRALRENRADLLVANKIEPHYKAYIIDENSLHSQADSKPRLIRELIQLIKKGTLWN